MAHPNVKDIVLNSWGQLMMKTPMLRVCLKLRRLKPELRALNKHPFLDIGAKVA